MSGSSRVLVTSPARGSSCHVYEAMTVSPLGPRVTAAAKRAGSFCIVNRGDCTQQIGAGMFIGVGTLIVILLIVVLLT